MSKIQEFLDQIKSAIYGEEVRGSIHDSIKQCYDDVTSGKTLADTAAANADTAANKANTAVENANAIIECANEVIKNAETAAMNANEAVNRVEDAAAIIDIAEEEATKAVENAMKAVGDAEIAVTNANTAVEKGNEVIENTETAVTNANEATENANIAAQSATDAAQTATDAAQTATDAAQSATDAAQTATDAAQTATDAAQAASGWANATATAETVEPEAGADVELTTEDSGAKWLHFSIPRGATGLTPDITFKVATGEPGTDVLIEQSGTAEEPEILLTIPRGDTGALGTSETAEDAAKLGGKAPEYYLQPFDYLQNDDFTNAVNQRGFTSDTPASGYPYVADRWYANGNGSTYAVSDDGLTLDASGVSVNASVSHVIERMLDNGEYTIIEYDKSGIPIGRVTRSVSGTSATYLSHEYGSGYYITFAYNDAKARFYAQVVAYSGQSHTVASLRMFKGAYTLETAPPYVPKGYAGELAECLRYYRVYATQDARPSHGRDCSPPMRLDAPTQGTLSIGDATYYYNSADL